MHKLQVLVEGASFTLNFDNRFQAELAFKSMRDSSTVVGLELWFAADSNLGCLSWARGD